MISTDGTAPTPGVGEKRKGLVLVAGATGYVGGHVVWALLNKGFKVRVLLRNPAQAERYANVANVEIVHANVAHFLTLPGVADGCDYVVSCLGYRWGEEDGANPVDALFKVYSDGNTNLFKEAAKAGVEQFVLVSNMHSAAHAHSNLVFEAREEAIAFITVECRRAHRAAACAARLPNTTAAAPTHSTHPTANLGRTGSPSPVDSRVPRDSNIGAAVTGDSGAALTLGDDSAALGSRSVPAGKPISFTVLDFAWSFQFIERQLLRIADQEPADGTWTAVGAGGFGVRVAPIGPVDLAARVADVVGDPAAFNTRQAVAGPREYTWLQVATLVFAALGRPAQLRVVPNWLFALTYWWFWLVALVAYGSAVLEREERVQHMAWQRLMYKEDSVGEPFGNWQLGDHLAAAAKRRQGRIDKLRAQHGQQGQQLVAEPKKER